MPLYVGLMSGTSMDSVDAALIETDGRGVQLLFSHRESFPDDIALELHKALDPSVPAERTWKLDIRLGKLFAAAANALLELANVSTKRVAGIGSHGQTIFHHPDGRYRFSIQLANPSVIAFETGIVTVANFRQMDLAAGGQGAPLAPAFHDQVFRAPGTNRGILNVGGIANLTVLNADGRTLGFDTGPGNTLMDGWASKHLGRPYDQDGAWAAGGSTSEALLRSCLADPYFRRPPPKSTGRELFNLVWLRGRLEAVAASVGSTSSPQDVQATLCELTARTIAEATQLAGCRLADLYVCGGGAHNLRLLERLRSLLAPCPVHTTDALGLDPDWVEAAAFGWLAHQRLAGAPANLPSVTGASRSVCLGGVYTP